MNSPTQRIAVFGGSFNPPGLHHRRIVEQLSRQFDRVLVIPCGFRPDKAAAKLVTSEQRRWMIEQTFSGLVNVEVLYFDLESGEFTRTFDLDEQLIREYDGELWHAVGTDIIQGGANARSEVHQVWYRGEELWTKLNFAIVSRSDVPASPADFPRRSELVRFDDIGSSTEIRKRTAAGDPIEHLVVPGLAEFIAKEQLYLNI
jgi:NAD+ kinase